MNKKGTRALASATVVGLVLATVATGNVKAAPGDVNKVQGNDRYETAANVAKANWKDGAKDVIIASGEGYADSLSASVLAKKLNAPIILTTAGELNSNAKSALQTLKPENVYVIGGNASVSEAVRSGLKKDYKVTELGGKTRFETNLAVANHLVDKLGVKADNVMVVNGQDGFSDALSAAPVAAAKEQVLLIVGRDASTADAAANFVKKHNSKVTVIGTEGVVPAAVYNKLGASERVNGGADRFETNLNIMKHFKLNADTMYVANATGQGYADALVASALAGKSGAPLVLVDTKDSQSTKNAIKYIADNKTDKTEVSTVGGSGVMPDEIVNEIETAVNPELSAAEKAVKAYEDAKIGTSDEIAAAKALKADAVKAVDNVKDATKKSAFEARIAAKDKAISDAEAKMEVSVQSVEATNLNQVKVVFTQKVDEDAAEDVTNYEIGGKKLTEDDAIAVLQDDGRTVMLTLAESENQYDEVTVKVKKGVLSEDKTKNVKEYEKDVVFKDLDAPKVSKVSVKGNNKIVVEFSEAVIVDNAANKKAAAEKLADKFELNGQSIQSLGYDEDNSEAKDTLVVGSRSYVNKVEFYFSSALDSGKNELKVLDGEKGEKGKDAILCDAAGFTVKEAKFDINIDKVTSSPKVKSVKGGTDGKIYIDFDRPMDTKTAKDIRNYKLNNTNTSLTEDDIVKNDGIELKNDDTQVKITLKNSSLIKTGANTIEINDKVKDSYGNKVDKDTRISFNAEKDEEKPEVVSVEAIDSETIRVKFNEDVKHSNATNKSNYELRDSDGIRIDGDIDRVDAANKSDGDTDVYDIKMKTKKKLTGAKYTLKVKNIADTSDNVMDDYETEFKGEDDEAPTVTGVSRSGEKVFVRFSEKMDRASLRKAENYRFKDEDNKVKELPSKATITVAPDDKTVTIEFPSSYKANDKIKGFIVKSDVKDVAGNKMEADHDGIKDTLSIGLKENSMKAKRAGDDVEVELVFDAAVDKVEKDQITFAGQEADSVRINGDKVTFKFNDAEVNGTNKAKEIKKAGSGLKAEIGKDAIIGKADEKISKTTDQVYDNLIAPELDADEKDGYAEGFEVKADNNKATITIAFDTQIAELGNAYLDDFKFIADTGSELEVKDGTENKEDAVKVVGNTITYTFDDIAKLDGVKSITVKADKDNIDVRTKKDKAGNEQRYVPTNDDINGWKLKIGDKAKEEIAEGAAEKTAVKAINEAKAEDMEKAITENAKVLGLELTEYNALKDKAPVHKELAGKPFANKAEVKEAFDKAVTAQKQAEAATDDQVAVNAEADKYEATATIANTVAKDDDVTNMVKKLKSGETETSGIDVKVTAVSSSLLTLTNNVVTLTDQLQNNAPEDKVTVTLTFEKGGKTATKDVVVTIDKQA
ncbi:cell wall-binding repeat-containing protein [Clostridium botulinum]|uniref:cell wall-binding repeat-containing protein n=1 Tax=Clostridium botulinum TaxID=1491 RepID=UPI00099BFEA1|nr:cell wall-binding repeat-containing protein [Clostridium botulinum]NFK37586.1 cell wall-binding repeat-containing protein [Clostridium botulinum H04402 065]NFB18520.1 cell wall-binding repeat-containing protein [Clostridium botulinum]NFB66530.1 cell wall-binding repeat-containing protein [Clostridium botulinum]NFB98987.1 cell wall-binding repeat-containing protein [Clostridium botulinum]NFC57131.1 cell wall-binding repeat-containing protein [Clostridium botulinum]